MDSQTQNFLSNGNSPALGPRTAVPPRGLQPGPPPRPSFTAPMGNMSGPRPPMPMTTPPNFIPRNGGPPLPRGPPLPLGAPNNLPRPPLPGTGPPLPRGRPNAPTFHPPLPQSDGTVAPTASTSSMSSTEGPKATGRSADGWFEYKLPSGRLYYHNPTINKTTYDKPESLMTEAEKAIPRCVWASHKTSDGEMYYYNKQTRETTWTEPEEFRQYREKLAEVERQEAQRAATEAAKRRAAEEALQKAQQASVSSKGPTTIVQLYGESNRKKKNSNAKNRKEQQWGDSRAERISVFWKLLDDKVKSLDARWSDVSQSLVNDKRYSALATSGERKQAFTEWQQKRQKQARENARMEIKRARDAFTELLNSRSDVIHGNTRYSDAEELLESDARWSELSETDRKELFEVFTRAKAREEEIQRQKQLEKDMQTFEEFLMTNPKLHVEMTWSEAKREFAEDMEYRRLDKRSRLNVFKKVILALEKEEEEKARREKEKRRQKQQEARSKYGLEVEQLIFDSHLKLDDPWDTAQSRASKCPSYTQLLSIHDNDTSVAIRVYRDTLDRLKRAADADSSDIFASSQAANLDVDVGSQLDKWARELLAFEQSQALSVEDEGEIPDENCTYDVEQLRQTESSSKHALILWKLSVSELKDSDIDREAAKGPMHRLVVQKPWAIRFIFDKLVKKAEQRHASKRAQKQRKLDQFHELLMECFFAEKHADATWSSARKRLERRTAFQDVHESDRKRLFEEHIAKLKRDKRKHTSRDSHRATKRSRTTSSHSSLNSSRTAKVHDSDEEGELPEEGEV